MSFIYQKNWFTKDFFIQRFICLKAISIKLKLIHGKSSNIVAFSKCMNYQYIGWLWDDNWKNETFFNFGPLMAFDGLWWPLMAFDGLWRPLTAFTCILGFTLFFWLRKGFFSINQAVMIDKIRIFLFFTLWSLMTLTSL